MVSFDLVDKIIQYISSKITFTQLEEWFVPRLPVFIRDPESDDADIISAIELGLSEMNAGIISENEFRSLLANELVKTVESDSSFESQALQSYSITGSSMSTTIYEDSTYSMERGLEINWNPL